MSPPGYIIWSDFVPWDEWMRPGMDSKMMYKSDLQACLWSLYDHIE